MSKRRTFLISHTPDWNTQFLVEASKPSDEEEQSAKQGFGQALQEQVEK